MSSSRRSSRYARVRFKLGRFEGELEEVMLAEVITPSEPSEAIKGDCGVTRTGERSNEAAVFGAEDGTAFVGSEALDSAVRDGCPLSCVYTVSAGVSGAFLELAELGSRDRSSVRTKSLWPAALKMLFKPRLDS